MRGTLQDVMRSRKRPTVCVGPDTSIASAVRNMNLSSVGSALVVHEGAIVGIVTERDLLQHAFADDTPGDIRFAPVERIMTSPVITRPPETTVAEAMQTMVRCRIRRLPVVEGPRIVGLVSNGDLTAWIAHELFDELGDLTAYVTGPYAATHARDVPRQ